jgi:hypothetical protein
MQQPKPGADDPVFYRDDRPFPMVWFDFEAFDINLDPYEFRVYAQIARRCSKTNRCWQGTEQMAQACRMSKRAFIKARNRLQELGMIVEVPTPDYIKDGRRVAHALTAVGTWKLGAPHAPIGQTRCTTCTYIDKQGAPGAPIANLSIDQEKSKKEKIRVPTPPPSRPISTVAQQWFDWARTTRPYLASLSLQSFAKAISQLQARHSITDEGMGKILRFVQQDSFWSENATSPCGLLKRSKNGLYKMENLLAAIKTDRGWLNSEILTSPEFEEVNF